MKRKYIHYLVTLACLIINGAYAQKLPNKQESSIWAPVNIKIDGKATEWSNNFDAHNRATDIYYTIANNQENLYIAVQARDPLVVNKLYRRGLQFTINPVSKNDKQGAITIVFPIWDKENDFHTNTGLKPHIDPTDPTSVTRADSFMMAVNEKMISKQKLIATKGITGVDTLISIYNQYGIKAAALFDDQMVYTLEMSIPLKYIPVKSEVAVLNYHIQLNALSEPMDNLIKTQKMGPDGRMIDHITTTTKMVIGKPADDARLNNLYSITDFWGEYTLAKKP